MRNELVALLSSSALLAILAAPPAAAWSEDPGVTLYADDGYRGESQRFDSDVPDLRRTRFGNDRASSIRVDPGCRVVLYRDSDFRGERLFVRNDVRRLGETEIGNDALSSLEVRCWRGWRDDGERGVVLFSDVGYRGQWQEVTRDVLDLRLEPIGNDRVSSVRVAPGCEVKLWSDSRFRGRSLLLREDTADLRRTPIGNDIVSSLEVSCYRDGWPDRGRGEGSGRRDRDRDDRRDGWQDGRGDAGRGVTLFDDAGFRGEPFFVSGDVRDLDRGLRINDRISSIRVDPGCEATLYSDADYRGRSVVVRTEIADLGRTPVGNDAVSSVRIRCD